MLTALRRLFARAFSPARAARAYAGAQAGRLYADWLTSASSADAEIRSGHRRLIDRSRDLERNNDYWRGYLRDCEDNIVGAGRFDLRVDAGEYRGSPPKWSPDRAANRQIEEAWLEWSRKGTATHCGRHSWRDVKRLLVRTVPRDGNFIARKITGRAAGNRFGFALQLWEVDHLDLERFDTLPGGGEIRFGIEFDSQRRVAAYWLKATHPGDYLGAGLSRSSAAVRFPAAEIYHVFVTERPGQSLGAPWCVAAITRLRQLGAFEEAAVIAARLGASKAGFFKNTGESGEWTGEEGANGRPQIDVQPGTFDQLPNGWDIATWDPQYPNIETSEFRKAMLRGIATGLGSSYTSLGNDLESVNYSSARVGLLDERETWKMHQDFYAEHFYEPVFADWLEQAILSGAVNLPLGKFAKFNRPRFRARRWPWVDPVKEVEAAKTAIALRLGSRRAVIEEAGGDVEDVFHDNYEDERLAESMGLSLSPAEPEKPAAVSPPPPASAEGED